MFWEKKKFLQCIFQRSFSADGYKQVYPTEKHFNNWDFFRVRFFTISLKNAFYEKFETHEKHQFRINVCAFIYLGLVGHIKTYRACWIHFATGTFSPCRTLPIPV